MCGELRDVEIGARGWRVCTSAVVAVGRHLRRGVGIRSGKAAAAGVRWPPRVVSVGVGGAVGRVEARS